MSFLWYQMGGLEELHKIRLAEEKGRKIRQGCRAVPSGSPHRRLPELRNGWEETEPPHLQVRGKAHELQPAGEAFKPITACTVIHFKLPRGNLAGIPGSSPCIFSSQDKQGEMNIPFKFEMQIHLFSFRSPYQLIRAKALTLFATK